MFTSFHLVFEISDAAFVEINVVLCILHAGMIESARCPMCAENAFAFKTLIQAR